MGLRIEAGEGEYITTLDVSEIEPNDHFGHLNSLAGEGAGIYVPVAFPWGKTFKEVTHKLNLDDPSGGVVFIEDTKFNGNKFFGLLQLLGINTSLKDYISVSAQSKDPLKECYSSQVRFMTSGALKVLDKNIETQINTKQDLSLGEAVVCFAEQELEKLKKESMPYMDESYHRHRNILPDPSGFNAAGIGFAIENSFYGIYRVWSRPWNVTH